MNIFKKTTGYSKLALAVSCALATQGGLVYAQKLEEIVVTAQKREQSIQDVPIAITSLAGDNIKNFGFDKAADIQYQIPGLIVSYSSTNAIPNFVLRGIGLNDFTPIQSSPVAIHVDDTYYGNATLLNFALFDIDRVDVLKGPQGTLYGRNSTGGAVNFFTRKPTAETEGSITVGAANFGLTNIQGFFNGALSEVVNGRVSIKAVDQSGGPYTHPQLGEIGEKQSFAARAQLTFEPNDKFDAGLIVFGGTDDSDANQYQGYGTMGDDCDVLETGVLSAANQCFFDELGTVKAEDDDPFTLQNGVINRDKIDALGLSLSFNYAAENFDLSSITAYNEADRVSQEDADGSIRRNVDVGYASNFSQFTQELRLTSATDTKLQWTLGLFYSTDILEASRTETDLAGLDFGRQNHAYDLETDSIAIFTHNEYQLNDIWSVIAGLRYTSEERQFIGGTIDTLAGEGPNSKGDFVPAPGPLPGDFSDQTIFTSSFLDDEIDFDELSWRIGLNAQLGNGLFLYASASNGFKSGGFVGDITLQPILEEPYSEETLTAYEIGLKTELLDGAVRWNTSLFYYDYEDIILALTIQGSAGEELDTFLTNENGSDATIVGIETDMTWAPAEGWIIGLGGTYQDSSQDALQTSPFQVSEELQGDELPYAPSFSANGYVRYSAGLPADFSGDFQLSFTTRGDHFGEAANTKVSEIQGYTLLDASILLTPSSEQWDVNLWIKNLVDENYVQYINDLSGLGSIILTPGTPRTYGIDFSYHF